MYLKFVDQFYEAYVDGKPDRKVTRQFCFRPHGSGVYRAYLPLGSDYVGKTLVVRVHSRYWRPSGIHREQLIGEGRR